MIGASKLHHVHQSVGHSSRLLGHSSCLLGPLSCSSSIPIDAQSPPSLSLWLSTSQHGMVSGMICTYTITNQLPVGTSSNIGPTDLVLMPFSIERWARCNKLDSSTKQSCGHATNTWKARKKIKGGP